MTDVATKRKAWGFARRWTGPGGNRTPYCRVPDADSRTRDRPEIPPGASTPSGSC